MSDVSNTTLHIVLPKNVGLYTDAGFAALGPLLELTGKEPLEHVIVEQQGNNTDLEQTWILALSQSVWLDELRERMVELRRLLRRLRDDAVPSLFVGRGNCLGSTFELALSCTGAVWTELDHLVGFPEVWGESFPALGVLDELALVKKEDHLRRWRREPVITIREAVQRGLIQHAGVYTDTTMLIEGFRSHRQYRRQRAPVVTPPKTRPQRAANEPNPPAFDPKKSTWETLVGLVENRRSGPSDDQMDRAVTHLSATHFVSRRFLGWARQHSDALDKAHRSAVSGPNTVFIALGEQLPPVESIADLLHEKYQVLLASDTPELLAQGLSHLFDHVHERFGSRQAPEIWTTQIAWLIGDRPPPPFEHFFIIEVQDSQTLRLSFRDSVVQMIDVTSPTTSRKVGWCELFYRKGFTFGELPLEVQDVLRVFCSGILTPSEPMTIPLSVLIRSLALQELVAASAHYGVALPHLLKSLASESSWGFSSDSLGWDYFLRYRSRNFLGESELPPWIDRTLWQASAWDQVVAIAGRQKSKAAKPLSMAFYKAEFAVYCGLVAAFLSHTFARKLQGEELTIDQLVFHAVGFPSKLGSPLLFLNNEPKNKLMHMAAKRWSNSFGSMIHEFPERTGDVL